MIAHFDTFATTAATISRAWQQHLNAVFVTAILEANGGLMPTDDELREWCQTIISADRVYYLLWKAPKYGMGQSVDLKYAIARVEAGEFGTPTKEL